MKLTFVSRQSIFKLTLLASAYFVTGKLGLMLPYAGSHITLVWLPSGIAVAALLRWGCSFWPGVFLGALAVNFAITPSLLYIFGIALGNTLGPLFSAWLLRRLQFDFALLRLRDIALLAGAAAIGMSLTAGNGAANLFLAGLIPAGQAVTAWASWWAGDWSGVLLATPLLLNISRSEMAKLWSQHWEFLLWLAISSALAWTVFFLDRDNADDTVPLLFIIPALLVWSAMSFGLTGSSLGTILLVAIAAAATHQGLGPFYHADIREGYLLLWLYLATLVFVQLIVSALQCRHKQSESRQRQANEKMQYMVATSPAILLASRIEENRLITHWVSDNLTRVLGYSIDEALQPDWWESHVHADDLQRILTASAVLFDGTQQVYEYRFLHKNGSARWIRDEQQLIRDDAGSVVEVLNAWTDITERKREEQELRIAATAFETQEGIIITNRDNHIIRVNQAFSRLTGYSAEEVLGKTPALFKSGRQDAEFYQRMWAAIEHDKHWEGEIWNRRKNGDIYPEWLIITAITDADGNITHYVAAFSDISQLKKNEAEIHALAFYDPLTKLPNRRLLQNRLEHALAMSHRSRLHGALIFLDLDHFKVLNDTQGHAVGDQLLIETARRLLALVREIDTVSRLGGDEFVVMLEDLSADPVAAAAEAQTIAEKIGKALAEPYLLQANFNLDGNLPLEHYSSTSIGVALFLGHQQSGDELMKRADMAMYQAKHKGRNTISFFDPLMQSSLHARAALENDLRLALENHEFCLYYQLQVDIAGRPLSAEALLRWQHPQRGEVQPEQFIPIAEETGLIAPIGAWVLQQACITLALWAADPELRTLALAVNVSAKQFKQTDFIEQITTALQQTGADPKLLKLEITESLVLDHLEDVIAKMRAIRNLGVHFAMDDFGTGYSSLSSLQRLPLGQLKIDRSFIRHLTEDSHDAAIVRAILALGKSLKLTIIAEGVETPSQHVYLAKHGCPVFQGFLFGKPMTRTEFETYIRHIGCEEAAVPLPSEANNI